MFVKIDYLDYLVSQGGNQLTELGPEGVKKFLIPKSVQEVRGFVGLCLVFRKFIDEIELMAFESLKSRVVEAPILDIFNPRDETVQVE